MTKPTLKFVNAETGEEIEREMNAAEFKQYEVDQAKAVAKATAAQEKEAAKNALLERLGITAEEALLLLS
jgi:hypothetical protein